MLLFLIVAFLIPVHVRTTPILIGILLVFFLIKRQNYSYLKSAVKTIHFWVLIIPFALYLMGLTYSQDIDEALRNTETALSLVIFPFLAVSLEQNRIKHKITLIECSFIAGVFTIMLYSLAVALINYIDNHDPQVFFYSGLISSPHHHSYYVLFAFIIIIHKTLKLSWQKSKKQVIIALLLALITLGFLVVLSSKITLLLVVLYIFAVCIKMAITKRIGKLTSAFMLIFFLLSLPAIYQIPEVRHRFDAMIVSLETTEKNVRADKEDSTTIRLKSLETTIKVIKENFWYGTGQGDLDATMRNEMKSLMPADYDRTFAPHNQFLRSFASFGICGLLSLLLLFGTMLAKSIRQRNCLFVIWTVISIAFFCIEDMLCIINGIIFFSFFSSIFLLTNNKNPQTQTIL